MNKLVLILTILTFGGITNALAQEDLNWKLQQYQKSEKVESNGIEMLAQVTQKDQEQKMPLSAAQKGLDIFFLPIIPEDISINFFHNQTSPNFSFLSKNGILWANKLLRPPTQFFS